MDMLELSSYKKKKRKKKRYRSINCPDCHTICVICHSHACWWLYWPACPTCAIVCKWAVLQAWAKDDQDQDDQEYCEENQVLAGSRCMELAKKQHWQRLEQTHCSMRKPRILTILVLQRMWSLWWEKSPSFVCTIADLMKALVLPNFARKWAPGRHLWSPRAVHLHQ